MPDDDRDDTTTAQAPVPGRLPESDEEVPTKVTSFSAAEIAKIDAEYEAQRKKAADLDTASIVIPVPTKITASKLPSAVPVPAPVPVPTPPKTTSSKLQVAAPFVAVPVPIPAPPPSSSKVAPPPTEAEEEDDSIVTVQTRPEDPADDSIVTVQKPPKGGVPAAPSSQPKIGVRIPVIPGLATKAPISQTAQSAVAVRPPTPAPPPAAPPPPSPPPRKKSDEDIYDAEEDRTERRDLPFEEIERAVSRAKLDSVSITEFPDDDSPTARRRAPGPYSHLPVETIASPTIRSATEAETFEAETDTDVSPTKKRVAKDVVDAARLPHPSDSDVIATERRQRENVDPSRLEDAPAIIAAIERGPISPRPPPATSTAPMPVQLPSAKPTMRFGATVALPQMNAAAQNAPLRGSDPSIALPLESSPRLQAVIPLVPSSGNIPVAPITNGIPPGTLPPGSVQNTNMPSSGMHAAAAPQGGQGREVPRTTGAPGSLQAPPNSFGVNPNTYSGAQGPPTGSQIVALPQSEPRWIVLVVAVLLVCMAIPVLLYFALRPHPEDDPAKQPTPVTHVSPRKMNKPLDIGKRPRER